MRLMRSLFIFATWSVAALGSLTEVNAAAADDKALVARVKQLVGQVTRSKSGNIIAIDLENRAATNDDLKLLVLIGLRDRL